MSTKLDSKKISKILISQNYIGEEDIKNAEKHAVAHKSTTIDYLLSQGLLTKDLLGQAIAEFYKIPYADLNSHPPSKDMVESIPEEIAKKYRAVIFKTSDTTMMIATDNPEQATQLTEIEDSFPKKKISIAYSMTEDIDASFLHYRKALSTRFSEILKKKKRVAPEIIEEIIKDSLAHNASDIHLEPQKEEVVIRFRIDGVLIEAGRVPKPLYENILNWIKVRSHLRIDEHFSAQDGSMRFENDEYTVDLRISIVPTLNGEKTAMRILAQYIKGFTLGEIGLSPSDQKLVLRASRKPFGMILVTGPTGSGKTTTLYSLLKILNTPQVNVTTIEDPVEYKVEGLNQIQVNTQTGLTFARGLRTIVRQDPDVILVGEIRDNETAEIAVNAALTGHLLLSTFHANDAATAIPRLLDMDIEHFLLSSTLEIIIAQRLARKICENCRYSVTHTQAELKKFLPDPKAYFPSKSTLLYKGKGCKACNNSGYRGRTAIFEILYLSQDMRDLILTNPSSQQIWELARKEGAHSLFEDGIEKVKNGITTLEEILRVATVPEISNLYNGKTS